MKQLFTQLDEQVPVHQLVDLGFHSYLEYTLKKDQVVSSRAQIAKLYGSVLVPHCIKLKKYREHFTDFLTELRTSKNFRDRQMYLKIAKSTFKKDNEIFKKHFAKSIGTDMCEEKVKVVQIQLAKLIHKIPAGQIRSADKVRDWLMQTCSPDVLQFLKGKENPMRFINMDKCKVQLASEKEEAKGAIDSLDEETLRKLDPEKSFGKEADDEELK